MFYSSIKEQYRSVSEAIQPTENTVPQEKSRATRETAQKERGRREKNERDGGYGNDKAGTTGRKTGQSHIDYYENGLRDYL